MPTTKAENRSHSPFGGKQRQPIQIAVRNVAVKTYRGPIVAVLEVGGKKNRRSPLAVKP